MWINIIIGVLIITIDSMLTNNNDVIMLIKRNINKIYDWNSLKIQKTKHFIYLLQLIDTIIDMFRFYWAFLSKYYS